MRIGGTAFRKPVAQGGECGEVMVIVEVGEQEDIWREAGDFLLDRGKLRVIAFEQIAQKDAGAIAAEWGMPSGKAQVFGGKRPAD
jgi:hypothetical protein